MICLTGDVHQKSFGGPDAPYSRYTEAQLARVYCEIAEDYNVKVTIFVTGKTCAEEPEEVKRISHFPNCEIGGHTYSAFRDPLQQLWKRFTGSRLGPTWYQERDIKRTIVAIERTTGKQIQSWRNHSYLHNDQTYPLLSQQGIRVVSDLVSNDDFPERLHSGLVSLPINTQPDHEILFHGKYVAGYRKLRHLIGRWPVEHWGDRVQQDVRVINERGGVATILAHPLCMELADGLRTFKNLCRFLSSYETSWVSAAIAKAHSGEGRESDVGHSMSDVPSPHRDGR